MAPVVLLGGGGGGQWVNQFQGQNYLQMGWGGGGGGIPLNLMKSCKAGPGSMLFNMVPLSLK